MSTIRTGDLAHFNRTTGNIQDVQSRVRAAHLQVSTGKAAHSYAELGADSGTLMRTETALKRTETFAEQNGRLTNELNLMDGALATIEDVAQEFRQVLMARRNEASGDAVKLDLEAEGMIDRVVNALNLKVDGRYAFAGSRTDTPPVDPAAMGDPADASYYNGDDIPLRARIDVDAEATYGVTADAGGFRELLEGLKLAVAGHTADDDDQLRQAANLADTALDGVIAERGALATVTSRVESTRASLEGTALYLKDTVSSIVDTDVPATMAKIAQDQVSLEASYAITSRLSRLSLSDYLR
ncbi:MAG: flagellin [Alphaproteobacteria bacterium]